MYDVENLPFMLEDALTAEGATHEKAGVLEAHVVSDQNLVTGQNPASTIGVARGMLEAMGKSTA